MPTLSEIAKKAKVSTAVVSRIVNNDKTLRVSDETRERVKKIVVETGYTPNRAARSLRSTETGFLAMVVHDATNPVYAEITRGAHEAATRAGKSILLIDASVGGQAVTSVQELISGRGIDGLILQAADEKTDGLIATAARSNIPMVQLQARIDAQFPIVALPDYEATRLATQSLIDDGHTRIACIATRAGLTFTEERIRGWRSALADAGLIERLGDLVYSDPNLTGGKAALNAVRSNGTTATGLVCCNVLTAIGAMQTARELSIGIPGDLSIVAIHDSPFAEYCFVPLTTVRMPLFELGQEAIKMLISPSRPDHKADVVLAQPPVLVKRASSARRL